MLVRDNKGNAQSSLTLTGWTALAGMASVVVLVMWAGSWVWKRYNGADKDGYTLVMKGGDSRGGQRGAGGRGADVS